MKTAKLCLFLASILGLAWAISSKSRQSAVIRLSFDLGAAAQHELFESVIFMDKSAESSKTPSTNDGISRARNPQRQNPRAARTDAQDEEWPEAEGPRWIFECVSYKRHKGTEEIMTQTELIDYEKLHNDMPSFPGPQAHSNGKGYPHDFHNREGFTWQVNKQICDSYPGEWLEFPYYADMRTFDYVGAHQRHEYQEQITEGLGRPETGPATKDPKVIRVVYLHRGDGNIILCDVIVHPWEKSKRNKRRGANSGPARACRFKQCRLKEVNR